MNKLLDITRWRSVVVILVIVASMVLSGCTQDEPVVHLYYYDGEDPYIATFVGQIQRLAERRFVLEAWDAANTQVLQNEQIDEGLRRNPDVIIVNPVDRLSAYTITARARELDLPVIFFNREPLHRDLETWERSYYVGARAEQSARFQAELVVDLFDAADGRLNALDRNGDGRIQTVILKGEQGHQDAEIRTAEVLRAFEESQVQIDLLATEVANWNRSVASVRMEEIARQFGDRIELVVSNNDAMALGAIAQLRRRGYFHDSDGDGEITPRDESWLPIVGIDGLEEAVQQIADGYLYGTVKNDSFTMAEAIVELAELLAADMDPAGLRFPLTEDTYVWIDYQPLILEAGESDPSDE